MNGTASENTTTYYHFNVDFYFLAVFGVVY
jgi:hypothetical protein